MQFENLRNIMNDHISRNAQAIVLFFIDNILNKIIKQKKKTWPSRFYGHNCNGFQTTHVLFELQFWQKKEALTNKSFIQIESLVNLEEV